MTNEQRSREALGIELKAAIKSTVMAQNFAVELGEVQQARDLGLALEWLQWADRAGLSPASTKERSGSGQRE